MEQLLDETIILIEAIMHAVSSNKTKVEKPATPIELQQTRVKEPPYNSMELYKKKQPLFIKDRGRGDLLTDLDRGTSRAVSKRIKKIFK